jgi:PTS system nitrogen regulatory IIA component
MGITDLFSSSNVLLDVSANTKRALLEFMSTEAASRLGRSDQEILDALLAREQIGSTALGKGVALPHAELDGDGLPIVLLARLSRGIDFDSRDDEPVDIVFLVLWPSSGGKGLLTAMSEICRTLRDPQSLRRIRSAETPEAVIDLVRQLAAARDGAIPATIPAPDDT